MSRIKLTLEQLFEGLQYGKSHIVCIVPERDFDLHGGDEHPLYRAIVDSGLAIPYVALEPNYEKDYVIYADQIEIISNPLPKAS